LTDALVPSRQLVVLLKVHSGYSSVSTAYVFPYPTFEVTTVDSFETAPHLLRVKIARGLH